MRAPPDDPDVLARSDDLGPLWRRAPPSTGTEQRTLADGRGKDFNGSPVMAYKE